MDMTLTADGNVALAAAMDRTVMLYDLRDSASALSAIGSLQHAATPSCLAAGSMSHHIMTGAYDGVVRIWDLRSLKGAMMAFKAWEGRKKVLDVDWKRGIAAIGGESGVEVWKAAEDANS
jgi:ribosome biogenesis protein